MNLSRPLLCGFLCSLILLPLVPAAQAEETSAKDISGIERIESQNGIKDIDALFDGNTIRAVAIQDSASLTLHAEEGIGSAYLIFDTEYGPYTVTDPEKNITRTFGEQSFLHEFLNLEDAFGYPPQTITFTFFSGPGRLNELTIFTPGEVPDHVQKWNVPKEGEIDLMLFSAHGDDEHLFFAGLLPCYATQSQYEVLVVYLTNHRNMGNRRCHEMLNGLWAVGVTNYPVFGPFGDYFSRNQNAAYALHESRGQTDEALLGYLVEQLRRYRPQVAVTHDVNGEYGHGQHQLCADLLRRGVEAAEDPQAYPELAAQYGTWQVPKTYLHLWRDNPITMDWDQPLERFDGMTAFQVSTILGFGCHKSQRGGITNLITDYQNAADIPMYSPCEFGLYRSTVGPDTDQQDFFEHLTSYHEQQQAVAAIAESERRTFQASQIAQVFADVQKQKQAKEQEALLQRIAAAEASAAQLKALQNRLYLSVFASIFTGSCLLVCLWLKKKNFEKK